MAGWVELEKDAHVWFCVCVWSDPRAVVLHLLVRVLTDVLPGFGRAQSLSGFLWAEIPASSRDALQQEIALKYYISYKRLLFFTIGIFLTKKKGGEGEDIVKKLLPALVWFLLFNYF